MKINNIDYYVYYVEQRIIRKSINIPNLSSYTFDEAWNNNSKIFINIKRNGKIYQIEFLISKTEINKETLSMRSEQGRPIIYIINKNFIKFLKNFNFEFIKDKNPICFSKNYAFEKQMYDEKIGIKIQEIIKDELSKA